MKEYSNVILAIPDASLLADRDLRITHVNDAFIMLFGYLPHDLIGRSPEYLEAIDGVPSGFWQVKEREGTEVAEKAFIQYRKKDGSKIGCLTRKVRLANSDGRHLGYLGILTPVDFHPSNREAINEVPKPVDALRLASQRKDLIPLLMEYLDRALGIHGGLLAVIQPQSRRLEKVFSWGAWSAWTDADLMKIASVSKKSAGAGTRWVWPGGPQGHMDHDLFSGLGGVVCTPLPFSEMARGVLWVGRTKPFCPGASDLITMTAELAMTELTKYGLHDQVALQSRRMAAIRRIDLAVKESMDLRVAVGVILDQVISHLEVDAADVLILHPDSVMLEVVAHRGFENTGLHSSRIRLGQSIPGKIALDREPVLIPDLGTPRMGSSWEKLLVEKGCSGYYGVPLVARGAVKGILEVFSHHPLHPDPEWERFLDIFAGQAAIAIDKAEMFENLQRMEAALDMSNDLTMMTLSKAVSLRDGQTASSSQMMIEKTIQVARAMGVLDERLVQIHRGVILHDIGKLGIPDGILFKPGPLTDEEWVLMRKHPEFAYEMLSPNPQLSSAIDIPYCHHERWDGSGYPRGLKEEQIPLAARIFAVVDVWAAMTSLRPYRPPYSEEETRIFILENAGTLFDPKVVEAFLIAVS